MPLLLRRVPALRGCHSCLKSSGHRTAPTPPSPAGINSAAASSSATAPPRRALATMGHGASTFYDPYTLLGVRRGCSEVELKKAYRKAALRHHPDRQAASGTDPADAEIMFKQVSEAYETIVRQRSMASSGAGGRCGGGGAAGPGSSRGQQHDWGSQSYGAHQRRQRQQRQQYQYQQQQQQRQQQQQQYSEYEYEYEETGWYNKARPASLGLGPGLVFAGLAMGLVSFLSSWSSTKRTEAEHAKWQQMHERGMANSIRVAQNTAAATERRRQAVAAAAAGSDPGDSGASAAAAAAAAGQPSRVDRPASLNRADR
eukprot:COSAG06_NODE_13404_length_1260_cov_2.333333_1_plen_313_part_10